MLPLWQPQVDRVHFEEPIISQIDEKFLSFFGTSTYAFTGFYLKPSDRTNPVNFVKILSLHFFTLIYAGLFRHINNNCLLDATVLITVQCSLFSSMATIFTTYIHATKSCFMVF